MKRKNMLAFLVITGFFISSFMIFNYMGWFNGGIDNYNDDNNSNDNSESDLIINYGYFLENAFPNLTFTRPIGIYHAGDDSNRLFVVEQIGYIIAFENNKTTSNKTIFLDITEKVLYGGEQGLLGLAFHPQYKQNGYFYIYYTVDSPRRSILSRLLRNSTNPNQANESSEEIILEVLQPFSNHNGGQIVFGPDNYLYIGLGDGGSGGDPLNHAQNRSTLLGALLRIEVDSAFPYAIPLDNPFVGNTEAYREEIYAFGLRNPWRFSFDLVTDRLWLADVGQGAWEEINLIEKGKNYGWNIMEGNHCYNSISCNKTGLELPIFEYDHSQGSSITGGFVYRGSQLSAINGSYIYGDFITGKIWALTYDPPSVLENTLLIDSTLLISSFGLDQHNELYISAFDGRIYKITN